MTREPERLESYVRLRLGAIALVAAVVLATRVLGPDPGARRESLLWVTLGLGYGHQLGAWWFAKPSRRTPLARAARGLTLASAGLVFALALDSPAACWLMVALAALGAWHVFENDLAQRGALGAGTRLPPLPREPAPHLVPLAATALAVVVAFAAPRLGPELVGAGLPPSLATWTPEEGIGVLLLYHVLAWAGRSLGAAAPGTARRQRAVLLAAVHGLPLVALLGLRSLAPETYAWLASPALYLFLAAAHAVQTCVARGLAPAPVTKRGRFPHACPTPGWGP